MAEQYKEMSPADVREQKMRDNMGKAADKAKENSLGTKTDKSMMQKALEWIDPTLKNGPINQNNRDVQDAKKLLFQRHNNSKNEKFVMRLVQRMLSSMMTTKKADLLTTTRTLKNTPQGLNTMMTMLKQCVVVVWLRVKNNESFSRYGRYKSFKNA